MMTSRCNVLCSILVVLMMGIGLMHVPAFADDALRAGAARTSIVPPFPTRMGGYFDRTDTFTGVESPVYARALVCSDGTETVAVVSSDLIAVSKGLVEASRARIQHETGIPGDHVLISAAHDHSAPSGFTGSSLFGQPEDTRLTEFLVDCFTSVVADAHKAMVPAQWGYAAGDLGTITSNRQQHNDTVIDPEVGVLKVTHKGTNDVIGILFNFTGHPVIMGGENMLLSCEYPGKAAEVVESVLGGVALFTQGACGDVTMKRSGSTFEEVARLGHILGGEVLKTAEQIGPDSATDIWSRFDPVDVEARVVPSVEEAESLVVSAREALEHAKGSGASEREIRQMERALDSCETTRAVAGWIADEPTSLDAATHASVHALRLGPVVLVGIPGELFVEYGLELKRRIRQDVGLPAMVVGYANDYIGYIVTPRAVATGGYEQAIARVAPSAGRTLIEAAVGIVQQNQE